MQVISAELSRKRSDAGRQGGIAAYLNACASRVEEGKSADDIGREEMRRRGKCGGRPRLKTLEELMVSTSTREQEERRALPGVKAELKLSNIVRELIGGCENSRDKKEGELAGYQTVDSPEGAVK